MRTFPLLFLLVLVLAPFRPVRAEVIVLRNGRTLSGKVLEKDDRQLRLRVIDGEGSMIITVPMDQVREILPRARTAREHIAAGERFLAGRDFEAALAQFTAALRLNAGAARAWTGLARAETGRGRPAVAVRKLRAALILFPSSFEVRLALGEAFLAAGDRRKARAQALVARRFSRSESNRERVRALLQAINAPRTPEKTADPRAPAAPPVKDASPPPEITSSGEKKSAAKTSKKSRALISDLRARMKREYPDDPGLVIGARVVERPHATTGKNTDGQPTNAVLVVKVSPARWSLLTSEDHAVLAAGWWELLAQAYPRARRRVTIMRAGREVLAVSWNRARHRMLIEEPGRQPGAQRR